MPFGFRRGEAPKLVENVTELIREVADRGYSRLARHQPRRPDVKTAAVYRITNGNSHGKTRHRTGEAVVRDFATAGSRRKVYFGKYLCGSGVSSPVVRFLNDEIGFRTPPRSPLVRHRARQLGSQCA